MKGNNFPNYQGHQGRGKPHAGRLAKAQVTAIEQAVRRGMAAGGKRGAGAKVVAGPKKGSGSR